MNKILALIALIGLSNGWIFAASDTTAELVGKCEQIAHAFSNQQVVDGTNLYEAETLNPSAPKERMVQVEKIREVLDKVSQLGTNSLRFETVSTLRLGDGYMIVKIIDRRKSGGLLYVLAAEKDSGRWYLCSFNIKLNSDFGDLLSELTPADFRQEPAAKPQTED